MTRSLGPRASSTLSQRNYTRRQKSGAGVMSRPNLTIFNDQTCFSHSFFALFLVPFVLDAKTYVSTKARLRLRLFHRRKTTTKNFFGRNCEFSACFASGTFAVQRRMPHEVQVGVTRRSAGPENVRNREIAKKKNSGGTLWEVPGDDGRMEVKHACLARPG